MGYDVIRFYTDMLKMYNHAMADTPSYVPADEANPKTALKSVTKHPTSYIRFLVKIPPVPEEALLTFPVS